MTAKLYHVFTQFCSICLNRNGGECTTPGCLRYAEKRVAQPLAAVITVLGGRYRAMPERARVEEQLAPRRAQHKQLHILVELSGGQRTLGQLAAAVYGSDTPHHRNLAKGNMKRFREHLEPLGGGLWRMVSLPPLLERHIERQPEAAE